jgi:hypothetical protein
MPQFPAWNLPVAFWTDAAQVRRDEIRQLVVDLAERTRRNWDELSRALTDELRKRVNVLDLATRHDIDVSGKLARSRVSFVLKEFLETQRAHDAALLESIKVGLREELRDELQVFAAAIDDDLFARGGRSSALETGARRRPSSDLDYLLDEDDDDDDDEDDDEMNLVDYDGSEFADD